MRVSVWVRGMFALLTAALLWAGPASAELAISANDQKVKLVNGVTTVQASPGPDNISVYDITPDRIRTVGTLNVPTSVVGPPLSVAIAPDESFALVTSNQKIDPADPTKTIPDTRLSVVRLTEGKPSLLATLDVGLGAAGVSISRDGTLALVANRNEGTVSVFTIAGGTLTPAGKVTVGDEKSGPSHVAITPDGKMALVSRDGDHKISVLSIEGSKVEYTKRDISAGLRPYGLDISSDGRVAVVANIGTGGGDADTVSVIDLSLKPPRVVDTLTVGQTPEGIKISPDGQWLAVTVMNGSNKPNTSPFFSDYGFLEIFSIKGTKLTKVVQAPIGRWAQGPAFSSDNKTILVSVMMEEEVTVFSWNGRHLKNTGKPLKVKGGSAALRFADKPVAAPK